jgi:hypothetical protein
VGTPQRRAEPYAVDGVPVIIVGTIGWLVAFVVLVAVGADTWWRWVCLTGFGLGLVGIPYLRRFQRR